ncbi:MAG: aminopeptidase [Candidatus Magasanikbacteria bacterium]
MDKELKKGAKTIVEQCLKVQPHEHVVLVNDGNDQELIRALHQIIEEKANLDYFEYPQPDTSGEEPPQEVHEALIDADVAIAPTVKSISHTDARKEACKADTRVATLPGINKKIWRTSLQADYQKVEEITEGVYEMLKNTSRVKITTPSGTDITFDVEIDTYHTDTGILHEPGDFGNLPAGEPSGYPSNIHGTLAIDHFPFSPSAKRVEIEDELVVSVEDEDGTETSTLKQTFEQNPNSRQIAEFGFGTNPEATLIGNTLQDEKVLGTVHIAFGDNCSYVPEGDERRNPCDIHWDTVCEDPTVYFDDELILNEGRPEFLD